MSVSMREMLEAGVHFGHQTRFWNPGMAPHIFGHRNKIHIINLESTVKRISEAVKFVKTLAANKGVIMFVSTKRASREIIAQEAARCKMPYVDQRWLGGMMTNFKTVKASINRLKEMEAVVLEGGLENLTKKDALNFNRNLDKLNKGLGGIKELSALPDAIFIIDVGYHKIAVQEANALNIPVVGVVDTNNSPAGVDYVIPGNDDSSRAVKLYAREIADAIIAGQNKAVEEVLDGDVAETSEEEFVEVESDESN